MTAIDASLIKFHISLNASDLDRSGAFYSVLFSTEPAKLREGYAKFELAEPPLVLSLIPGGVGGNVNHAGLRVQTADELVDIQRRLETAGVVSQRVRLGVKPARYRSRYRSGQPSCTCNCNPL